jgi:hypothetical protein
MNKLLVSAFCAIFCIIVLPGCAPSTIKTISFDIEKIPEAKYETYLYEGGAGRRWRAVFLKDPQSPYQIEAGSLLVTPAVGTYAEAVEFMNLTFRKAGIRTERVFMHDKPVGYLMVAMPDIGDQQYWFEVLLYEERGKVIFDIREPMTYHN